MDTNIDKAVELLNDYNIVKNILDNRFTDGQLEYLYDSNNKLTNIFEDDKQLLIHQLKYIKKDSDIAGLFRYIENKYKFIFNDIFKFIKTIDLSNIVNIKTLYSIINLNIIQYVLNDGNIINNIKLNPVINETRIITNSMDNIKDAVESIINIEKMLNINLTELIKNLTFFSLHKHYN